MSKNAAATLGDQRTLDVLYLVAVNAAAIPHPNSAQRALGKAAAQALIEAAPAYFDDRRRPLTTSKTDWLKSRRRVETAARSALKTLDVAP